MYTDRKNEFGEYVTAKYGPQVNVEELYSGMASDSNGKCTFIVDFMDSVVEQQHVTAELVLSYFRMKYREIFDAAATTDYLMIVKRALSVLPIIENEALVVRQVLDGLQPDSFCAQVMTICIGIERAPIMLCIEQIRGVMRLKQQSMNLNKRLGDNENCGTASAAQSNKPSLSKPGIGDKKQIPAAQPVQASEKPCSNCKLTGHTPNLCPSDCTRCILKSCGKTPNYCPVWVKHLRDRATSLSNRLVRSQ
jgi:hypothetical protein